MNFCHSVFWIAERLIYSSCYQQQDGQMPIGGSHLRHEFANIALQYQLILIIIAYAAHASVPSMSFFWLTEVLFQTRNPN
mmetsp:Transcript_23746/g.36402  ORF Transcript_23746/g.36402 Transcript_23746/m.36402 type:complete len:80 (-) Transcript_23746:1821-2060(-)